MTDEWTYCAPLHDWTPVCRDFTSKRCRMNWAPFETADQFLSIYEPLRQRALARPLAVGDTLLLRPPGTPPPSAHCDFESLCKKPSIRKGQKLVPRPFVSVSVCPIVEVVQCIQSGLGKQAQVYLVKLHEAGTEHLVVLKVLQESLFDYPLMSRDRNTISTRNWPTGWERAAYEEAAYKALELFQGTNIPWLYGRYFFCLPCGESSFGLLLEYITSPRLDQVLQATPPPPKETIKDLFKAFLVLLNQFHQMIIQHDDIAERNLFVTEAADGALGPLILDFGSSHVECHPPPSECEELAEVFQKFGVPMDWLAEAAEEIKFKVLGVNWSFEEADAFSALSASTSPQDWPTDDQV